MLHKKWNYLLLLNFFFVLLFILFLGQYYKSLKTSEYSTEEYEELSSSMIYKLNNLISEKKNATLSIALSQAKNATIHNAIKNNINIEFFLKDLSLQLRKETDFKNVWFQIIDKNGISLARSWINKRGDNLTLIRDDIKSMMQNPHIRTTISVGIFDISFKAMIPIYSQSGEYLGIFEAITHFNSIAEKMSKEGVFPIVLVDERYTKQLKHPYSEIIIHNRYVANKNADKRYLSLLQSNGTSKYIQENKKYLIDKKDNNIVINYTLFATDDLPMANILLFKNLDTFNMLKISNMKILVNLLSILALLVTIIIFFFLYHREEEMTTNEDDKTKYILLFGVLTIGLAIIYYQFIFFNYAKNRAQHLLEHTQEIERNYNIIYDKFKTVASTIYELTLNKDEVRQNILNAYGSEELKNSSREQLLTLLKDKYDFLTKEDLQQLHFHLRNNESFLRFSHPDIYGEDLTRVRPMVDWVNKNNKAIEGFANGIFYNDFRFIYPLTEFKSKGGQEYHIGSVEVSFSPYAIIKEFVKDAKTKAGFIVNSTLLTYNTSQEEKLDYRPSKFQNFLHEEKLCKQLKNLTKSLENTNITEHNIHLAQEKISQGKIFTLISKDKMSYYTFIPIKDSLTNKVLAAIIIQTQTNEINNRYELAQLQFFLGLIAIILFLLFIYREYTSKRKLKELSIKTRQILDTQDSIVIITDSKKLLDVNKRFLTFFDLTQEEVLSKKDYCICHNFIKKEYYFSAKDEDPNWVEEIMQLNQNERIVLMLDRHGIEHSFSVSVSKYAQKNFILTFNDITYTIQEQLKLKQKILLDKLTGAYNREFFYQNIKFLIHSCKSQGNKLGLLMLDIDHFKKINDTYGHNKGDEVLVKLSRCIQDSIRTNDFFIRWGGEEFILLICVKSTKESAKVAEILRKKIANLEFEEIEQVTCSFGAIVINEMQETSTNIERVDRALYQAKETGRNRVVIG